MWPFPFWNKVALVHCSLILLQGINLPHGELSYSMLKLSYLWMRAVTALRHSPVRASSPGHSPSWCFRKASLIQLSSRSKQTAVSATSLAFLWAQFTGAVSIATASISWAPLCSTDALSQLKANQLWRRCSLEMARGKLCPSYRALLCLVPWCLQLGGT